MTNHKKKTILAAASLALLGLLIILAWLWWPKYLMQEAEIAISANQLDRAESLLSRLIRRSPDNPKAHFLLARVLRRLHRPDEAEDSLRQAQRQGISEEEVERELALDEAAKQFRPGNAYALRKLAEKNPHDLEVLEALAEGYASIHDWQEADFYLTVLIAKKPREAKYYFERGRVRQVVPDGQGHDKAVADYRETLVRSPKHFEAQLGLAQCLLSDAHLDSAQREFETCRDINPRRTEPLIGLAICAVEEEDLQKAQELLTEALNYEPDSVTALAMLGDLRLRRQEYKEAILYFQKVVALDPANKAAHLKLAQAFRSSGKAVEAKNQEDAYQRLERMRNKNSSRPR